mmetsp:Transcript_110293/g.311126  ORF Transcript_110293/g.311126 Transcript_110293/m.311126 type:complete len:351 (-) Transcript_110293:103-1155(-)
MQFPLGLDEKVFILTEASLACLVQRNLQSGGVTATDRKVQRQGGLLATLLGDLPLAECGQHVLLRARPACSFSSVCGCLEGLQRLRLKAFAAGGFQHNLQGTDCVFTALPPTEDHLLERQLPLSDLAGGKPCGLGLGDRLLQCVWVRTLQSIVADLPRRVFLAAGLFFDLLLQPARRFFAAPPGLVGLPGLGGGDNDTALCGLDLFLLPLPGALANLQGWGPCGGLRRPLLQVNAVAAFVARGLLDRRFPRVAGRVRRRGVALARCPAPLHYNLRRRRRTVKALGLFRCGRVHCLRGRHISATGTAASVEAATTAHSCERFGRAILQSLRLERLELDCLGQLVGAVHHLL